MRSGADPDLGSPSAVATARFFDLPDMLSAARVAAGRRDGPGASARHLFEIAGDRSLVQTAAVRFTFEGCELDLDRYEVRRDGDVVAVEPQVFDVLVHLVRHRDRVVPKEELLDEVWGDRFVSESALTSRIKAARRAIGDDGTAQRMIRTVHGRGYRFVADVGRGAAGGGHR